MFHNREEAALQLADMLKGRVLRDPLVLAIPRGGVIIGSVLAREIEADLDVVLSRKLRAPSQPELAIGAISEDGRVFLNEYGRSRFDRNDPYVVHERKHQLIEMAKGKLLFRKVRSRAPIKDRTVIIADDGIATGSTMIAALRTIKSEQPYEVIVAVPVASPDRLRGIHDLCDEAICLLCPEEFRAIGEFYEDFDQVDDAHAVELLRSTNRSNRLQVSSQ
jgi:putative phosphoribosyl transferase